MRCNDMFVSQRYETRCCAVTEILPEIASKDLTAVMVALRVFARGRDLIRNARLKSCYFSIEQFEKFLSKL